MEYKRMRHPNLEGEITVPASAVPHHGAAGWQLVEDKPSPQTEVAASAETTETRPPRRRRTVEEESH